MLRRIVAGIVLLATCAVTAAQAGPERLLRVGTADIPGTLEPGVETSNTGLRVIPNVFETLIEMDPRENRKLEPGLAERWQRVDGRTLELTLRQGVTFHNGEPLTSADAAYSIKRVLDEDFPGSLARSLLATIERVEAVDEHTVRVTTREPDPILEYRLASLMGAQIVPRDDHQRMGVDAFGREPVGTGPYRVVEYTADTITLEAFDGYWGPQPNASRVSYRVIPETAARVTALVNDEVDIITQIPPDQVAFLERQPEVRVETTPIDNIHMLVLNSWDPPMDDPRLRQALRLGIDRQLLVDTLWGGLTEVPRSHQYPAYGPLYNEDRPRAEYDPERARQLVEASSYDGETLYYDVTGTYYTNELAAAQAIAQMWQDLGLDAQVRVLEPSQHSLQNAAVIPWSNTMRFPDPAGGLWLLWGPDSYRQDDDEWQPQNDFNEVGREMETTFDLERRYELSQRLLDLWEEETPGTVLWYPAESWGVREDVQWRPVRGHAMHLDAEHLSFAE